MSVKVITADMAGLFLVTTVNMSELAFRNSTLDDSGNGIEMPAMTKYSFAIENTINTVKIVFAYIIPPNTQNDILKTIDDIPENNKLF